MSTESALTACLNECMKVAKGPQPKDIYDAQQWEMAGAHVVIMNGLLHLYKISSTIQPEQHRDFVEYALQWYAVLEHHHVWEETIYYPLYNPKFNTDSIVAEHESFHQGSEEYKAYLVSCLPEGATWGYNQKMTSAPSNTFDATAFRSIIDAFAAPLATHLQQEITYLSPDKIRASGLTVEEMKHLSEVSEKHMKGMPPTTFLVYVVTHTPKESEFPPVPGFVKSFLVPYIFYHANKRLWKFSPKA